MQLTITPLAAVPSMGALIGARGSSRVLDMINSKLGNTCFGSDQDPFKNHYQFFMKEVVHPIRQVSETLFHAHKKILVQDTVCVLDSIESLKSISPCMQLPLLTGPLWDYFIKGRIDGWGFDPTHLGDAKKMYDRLIRENGIIYLNPDELKKNNNMATFTNRFESNDPEYTADEVEMLRDSSDYIEVVLATTQIDPTDPDQLRG